MARTMASVDKQALLGLRQVTTKLQQEGHDVRAHKLLDKAINQYVKKLEKKLA